MWWSFHCIGLPVWWYLKVVLYIIQFDGFAHVILVNREMIARMFNPAWLLHSSTSGRGGIELEVRVTHTHVTVSQEEALPFHCTTHLVNGCSLASKGFRSVFGDLYYDKFLHCGLSIPIPLLHFSNSLDTPNAFRRSTQKITDHDGSSESHWSIQKMHLLGNFYWTHSLTQDLRLFVLSVYPRYERVINSQSVTVYRLRISATHEKPLIRKSVANHNSYTGGFLNIPQWFVFIHKAQTF